MVSTLSVLSWIAAYDHSVLAVHLGEGQLFAHGTASAVEAIIGDSGADVRLGSPVSRIEQDDRQVRAITMSGEVFTASAAVIALPLNVLKDIEFLPALHPAKQAAAAEGHVGRATKVWALVRGVPPAFFGAGLGPGLIWLSTQEEWPEGSLMLGFGPGPESLNVHSIKAVQRAVEAFIPGAEVLRIDAHDWNADPYANGAWVAFAAGQLTRWGPALRIPEGRLAFASSDLATQWAGWIDGAIASGSQAAREVESFAPSP
jgi:monoamine oxidase